MLMRGCFAEGPAACFLYPRSSSSPDRLPLASSVSPSCPQPSALLASCLLGPCHPDRPMPVTAAAAAAVVVAAAVAAVVAVVGGAVAVVDGQAGAGQGQCLDPPKLLPLDLNPVPNPNPNPNRSPNHLSLTPTQSGKVSVVVPEAGEAPTTLQVIAEVEALWHDLFRSLERRDDCVKAATRAPRHPNA